MAKATNSAAAAAPATKATVGQLLTDLRSAEASRANNYRALVCELADGNTADQATVAGVLAAAGKTIADLEADLATLARRRQLSVMLAARDAAVDARREIAAAMEKLTAAHRAATTKAEEEYQSALAALRRRDSEQNTTIDAATRAESELRTLAIVDRALPEAQARRAELVALQKKVEHLDEQRRHGQVNDANHRAVTDPIKSQIALVKDWLAAANAEALQPAFFLGASA